MAEDGEFRVIATLRYAAYWLSLLFGWGPGACIVRFT